MLVYGARYAATTGPLAAASVVVLVTVLNAVLTCVLFAKGSPALHRKAVVSMAAAMLVAIYPAIKFLGPIGGQIAALFAATSGYLYQLALLRRVTGLNLFRYGTTFALPAISSVAMLGLVFGCRRLGVVAKPATDLALCIAGYLVVYAVCMSAHLRDSQKHIGLYRSQSPESV